MKTLFTTAMLMIILGSSELLAQVPDFKGEKLKAMNELSFLLGEWDGEGWMYDRTGTKHDFVQYEKVEKELDGHLIRIRGIGLDPESKDTVHNAFAVISWNPYKKEYQMESHLANGMSTTARAGFEGDIFVWGFSPQEGLEIRYEISNPSEGIWTEVGKVKMGENPWRQNYSSTLKRK